MSSAAFCRPDEGLASRLERIHSGKEDKPDAGTRVGFLSGVSTGRLDGEVMRVSVCELCGLCGWVGGLVSRWLADGVAAPEECWE